MAFGFIQKASAIVDASGTSVTVTVSSTTAGSLLVAWVKWEGALAGSTVSVVEGAGTFTTATAQAHSNGDLNGQFHYKLVAAGGDTSIVATWTSARAWKAVHVWEFSYTGTCSLDTAIATGTGTNEFPTSGNITTTGTDEVVLGGLSIYASEAFIAGPLINGVAAAQSITGSQSHHSWERIVTATFTGAATGTKDNLQPWVCHAIAFKVAGAPTVALTGTATDSITEADIVAGGKTVILTVTGDTVVPAAGGEIEYVGGQGAGFAGTLSAQTINFALTNGLASVPAAGDLVVIAYTVGSTVDRSLAIRNTSAVDYTLAGSELNAADTFDVNLRVAYRFMPGTPETQFVLTETVGGGTGAITDAGRYTVHVFRGVDPAVIDVAVTTATGIDSRVANPPTITPSTPGAWIYVCGAAASATGGTYTAGYLTDFRAGSTADTNDAQIGAGYVVWTSGAYDPAAFGAGGTSTTNDSWAAVTMSLRHLATTPFADARAAIITGLDSAQSEADGWDATVKPNIPVGNVVRTSDTVITITLQAQSDYDITATETITATVPATALTGASPIVSTPTFSIDPAAGSIGAASGTSTATATGIALKPAVGASAGTSTVAATGRSTAETVAVSSGTGTAIGVSIAIHLAVGSSSGTGAATATGLTIVAGVGASAGTSTAAAVGGGTIPAVGSASGTGTATGIAPTIESATGSASGTASVSATGSSVAASVGSVSCLGVVTGVGGSTFASTGNVVANSTTLATGSSTNSGIGAASGAGSASAVGVSQGTASGAGSSSGIATVLGIGTSSATAAGLSAAVGAAVGFGTGLKISAGASTGLGTAAGAGRSTFTAAGLSEAIASAFGFGVGIQTTAGVGTATGTGTAAAVSAQDLLIITLTETLLTRLVLSEALATTLVLTEELISGVSVSEAIASHVTVSEALVTSMEIEESLV